MAQSGYTPLAIYHSATASNVPSASNLQAGELAINTADGKLFYKDSSGNVQTIASKSGNVNVSSFSAGTTGFTPNTATTGVVTLAGTLNVSNGGTGLTTLGSGYIPYGNGTSAFNSSSAFNFVGSTLTSPFYVANGTTTGSLTAGAFSYGTLGYSDVNILASFSSGVNTYNQMVLQNTSSGNAASTNFNVSNNNATSTTNFGEFGINSSGFTGSGAFSTAGNVYLAAASTDIAIGTYGANAIHFVVNSGATDAATISSSGVFSLATPLATTSGGTGRTTYNTGDIPFYSTGTALNTLALGTTNYVLTAGASAPQYVAQSTLSVGSATNLVGGTTGALHYQSAPNTSTFLSLGTTNYVLTAGASAPQYVAQSTLSVGSATTATNIAGGAAGSVPYNTASGTTTFLGLGTQNYVLTAGASAPQYTNSLQSVGVTPRVVVIADGTSVTINGDTTDVATQANTQATGTLTINAPTGTPVNGQKLIFRLNSVNVQTFSWNAIFAGSNDLALPATSTGSSKYDYVGFMYNSTAGKWQLLAKVFGF